MQKMHEECYSFSLAVYRKETDTQMLVWQVVEAKYRVSQKDTVIISSVSETILDREETPCVGKLCEVEYILFLNSAYAQVTIKSLPSDREEELECAVIYAPCSFIHHLDWNPNLVQQIFIFCNIIFQIIKMRRTPYHEKNIYMQQIVPYNYYYSFSLAMSNNLSEERSGHCAVYTLFWGLYIPPHILYRLHTDSTRTFAFRTPTFTCLESEWSPSKSTQTDGVHVD